MTDGIWIRKEGNVYARPKTKKEVRETAAKDPSKVIVEYTSIFDSRYGTQHRLIDIARGTEVTFVGPDPCLNRRFYGTVVRHEDGSIEVL